MFDDERTTAEGICARRTDGGNDRRGCRERRRQALVDRLVCYDRVVEVGVGRRPGVALGLVDEGVSMTVTDLTVPDVSDRIDAVADDVTDPDPTVYADADAVYALNCPPELHRSLCAVAREVGADAFFSTLGTDPPAVEAVPETLHGETLFRAVSHDRNRTRSSDSDPGAGPGPGLGSGSRSNRR